MVQGVVADRPNIIVIMVDQLSGTHFPDGPAQFLRVPNLRRLSDAAVNFATAYCASPLCVPARAAFMTGRLPSRIGTYDNAAGFASSVPTAAHYLRHLGYRSVLCGKMHFVGPDQLHGFEERLTTDVYPADFGWTPDWLNPDKRIDWWYHNLGSVTDAGVSEFTNQLEFDDEVAYQARLCLYRAARRSDPRPLFLTVGFTHPHDPYVARQRYWDLYPEAAVPMPLVEQIPYAELDPHSRRIQASNAFQRYQVTTQNIIDARRAYFANVSYLDEKIGEILEVLDTCRLMENTVIVFCADHGDMLGERGLWFKMSFFEGSSRIPLFIAAPQRYRPRMIETPVSAMDLLPTLVELAGGDLQELGVDSDGASLLNAVEGGEPSRRGVLCEYAAEASIDPMLMIREDNWKLTVCEKDPAQLFDLVADPQELQNRASDPVAGPVADRLRERAQAVWDIASYRADVLRSQAERRLIYAALRKGEYCPWDYQPPQRASQRFMRNHLDLNEVEASARVRPDKD